MINRGFYKHYKGGLYYVLGMSQHTETGEKFVLYLSLYYWTFWVRPPRLWFDWIDRGFEDPVTRFTPVSFWYVLKNIWKKPKTLTAT